jgi:hypothetical protein
MLNELLFELLSRRECNAVNLDSVLYIKSVPVQTVNVTTGRPVYSSMPWPFAFRGRGGRSKTERSNSIETDACDFQTHFIAADCSMSAEQHASSHPHSDSVRSEFVNLALPSLPVSASTTDLSDGRAPSLQLSPPRPGPLSLPSESVFTALNAIIPSKPGILSPLRPPGDAIPIQRDVAVTPQRRFKPHVPSPSPAASATGVLSLSNVGVQALLDIRSARHQSTPIQSRARISPFLASRATPGPQLVAASLRESESVSLAANHAIEQAAQTVRAIGRAEIRSGAAPPASLFSHAQAAAAHSSFESNPRHRLAAMGIPSPPASTSSAALSDSWLLSADADAAVSAAKRVLDAIASRKAAAVATRSMSHASPSSPIDRIAAENQSESALASTASRLAASIPVHPPVIAIEPMTPGALAIFEGLGNRAVEEPLIQEPISVSPVPTKQADSPTEPTHPDALSSQPSAVSKPITENGATTHSRALIMASPAAPAIVFDLVSPTVTASVATVVNACTDPAASQLAEIETSKATIRNLVDGSIAPILELSFDTKPVSSATDSPAADARLEIQELVLLTDRMYDEDLPSANSFHPAADEKMLQQINHIAAQMAVASALTPMAPPPVTSPASHMYPPVSVLQDSTVQLRLPTIAPTALSSNQNGPQHNEGLQWHAEPMPADLESRRPLGHMSTRVADRQRSLSQWIAAQSRTFGPPATEPVPTAANQSTIATAAAASPLCANSVAELGTPNLAATRIRMRDHSRFRSIGVDLEKVCFILTRPLCRWAL